MNLLFEGIKYKLFAKKRHRIHSPFVYTLSDMVLRQQVPNKAADAIAQFDLAQKKNAHILDIEDHGAGSKSLANKRKVCDIHRTSSSKTYGKILFQLSSYYQPSTMLELGTSLGRGSLMLHYGHPNACILTLEGCPAVAKVAQENIAQHAWEPSHMQVLNTPFLPFLESYRGSPFDFIYIDGHHDGEALLHYLAILQPYLHDNTLILLDDIRWSTSMFKAWNAIIANPFYHVTVDFFRMGLITPRNVQHKEHFILRT